MPFLTGALPSPRHRIAAAVPHLATAGVPDSFLVLPRKLDIWGNDRFGCCVSAEEAFKLAAWSTQIGLDETFVDPSALIAWARRHHYLNGADLTSVMDDMIKDGIQASDGKTYHDGAYHSVDWTDYRTLCSAVYTGPVKLGMAARQLQNAQGVGQHNGWFAHGFRHDGNIDHCTGVCGFGTAAQLAALFAAEGVQVTVPPEVPPATPCVAYFTWGTVGIMDHQSLVNTTGEAWVRNPSTAEQPAPDPGPQPSPNPTPTPAADRGWWDDAAKQVHPPAGWTVRHTPVPSITIHPAIRAIDIPAGYTIA